MVFKTITRQIKHLSFNRHSFKWILRYSCRRRTYLYQNWNKHFTFALLYGFSLHITYMTCLSSFWALYGFSLHITYKTCLSSFWAVVFWRTVYTYISIVSEINLNIFSLRNRWADWIVRYDFHWMILC